MQSEDTHPSLNYVKAKDMTVKSREYRTRIYPESTSAVGPDQNISIRTRGGLQDSFLNWSSKMTLNFDITPIGSNLTLDKSGAINFFKRMTIGTPSMQLCDLPLQNVFACMMADLEPQLYKMNQGKLLMGKGNTQGIILTAGQTYSFCIPLNYNCFAFCDKMIPLMGESLEINLETDTIQNYGLWAGAQTSCDITNIELVSDIIQLNPQTAALIKKKVGGVYTMMTTSIKHTSDTIAANDLAPQFNVSTRVNSCEKVLLSFRRADKVGLATTFGVGSRCFPALTSAQLTVNNLSYPTLPLKGTATNSTQYLSELLSSFHSLNKPFATTSLNALGANPERLECSSTISGSPFNFLSGTTTGVSNSTCGSFILAFNLALLNESHSQDLISGVNTSSGGMSINLSASAMPQALVVDIYTFYNQRLSLDMNQGGTWLSVF